MTTVVSASHVASNAAAAASAAASIAALKGSVRRRRRRRRRQERASLRSPFKWPRHCIHLLLVCLSKKARLLFSPHSREVERAYEDHAFAMIQTSEQSRMLCVSYLIPCFMISVRPLRPSPNTFHPCLEVARFPPSWLLYLHSMIAFLSGKFMWPQSFLFCKLLLVQANYATKKKHTLAIRALATSLFP